MVCYKLIWLIVRALIAGRLLSLSSLQGLVIHSTSGIAWLKGGDQQAYRELVRARRAADPDIRETAEIILSEMTTEKQEDGPSDC